MFSAFFAITLFLRHDILLSPFRRASRWFSPCQLLPRHAMLILPLLRCTLLMMLAAYVMLPRATLGSYAMRAMPIRCHAQGDKDMLILFIAAMPLLRRRHAAFAAISMPAACRYADSCYAGYYATLFIFFSPLRH